jgi:hypothetical protein
MSVVEAMMPAITFNSESEASGWIRALSLVLPLGPFCDQARRIGSGQSVIGSSISPRMRHSGAFQ